MEIGVLNPLRTDRADDLFAYVTQFGLKTCQLVSWEPDVWDASLADRLREQSAESGVGISGFWAGFTGPMEWNFTAGPTTLGVVPVEHRDRRLADLKKGADFAKRIAARAVVTHCGFIPENMTDPSYEGVVEAIREIAEYCRSLDLEFWFETGQETPVVLLRTIERVAAGNLGINLDPANLIMYGKGNPIDALDVFGQFVRNIHVKDGMCPTDGEHLGREVQVGQGKVRFPEFIRRLKEIGFDGELIIEREIHDDPAKNRDIIETIDNLRCWIAG